MITFLHFVCVSLCFVYSSEGGRAPLLREFLRLRSFNVLISFLPCELRGDVELLSFPFPLLVSRTSTGDGCVFFKAHQKHKARGREEEQVDIANVVWSDVTGLCGFLDGNCQNGAGGLWVSAARVCEALWYRVVEGEGQAFNLSNDTESALASVLKQFGGTLGTSLLWHNGRSIVRLRVGTNQPLTGNR